MYQRSQWNQNEYSICLAPTSHLLSNLFLTSFMSVSFILHPKAQRITFENVKCKLCVTSLAYNVGYINEVMAQTGTDDISTWLINLLFVCYAEKHSLGTPCHMCSFEVYNSFKCMRVSDMLYLEWIFWCLLFLDANVWWGYTSTTKCTFTTFTESCEGTRIYTINKNYHTNKNNMNVSLN